MTEIMSAGVWVLGYVVALLVCCGLFVWVMDVANGRIITPWWNRAVSAGQRDVRERLLRDSNWFSEDLATMNLIKRLAFDHQDISDIREAWRKESRRG